jgi:thioredoxin 2
MREEVTTVAVSTNPVIVSCSACGQKNRVPVGRPGAVCGRCGTALPETPAGEQSGGRVARPIDVTDATFETEVLGSPLPVLLDCWAAWCGPCRAIAPVIERLAAAYAGRVSVCKLDVDANPRTRAALNVQGIPALFVIVGRRVVDRLVGAHPYEVIEAKLRDALARPQAGG